MAALEKLQGTWTVGAPGPVIEMTPPQLHMHLHVILRAGMLPIITVGEPGTHGAAVTGTQGMGVSTPIAAVVAAATVGFASDMHIANGGMLANGLLSMIVAAGGPPAIVLFVGSTFSALGATPNEHIIMVPVFAIGGMFGWVVYGGKRTTRATSLPA